MKRNRTEWAERGLYPIPDWVLIYNSLGQVDFITSKFYFIYSFIFLLYPEILFIFFSYFNWRLITLQYCSGFCHTLTWISHGCTLFSVLNPPSHLLPHPIPQGHPSAPAMSTLSHASNLDWSSISYMWYICFNAILSNHLTLAFSHRVQKTVLYICVSFAVSHIGSLLPPF